MSAEDAGARRKQRARRSKASDLRSEAVRVHVASVLYEYTDDAPEVSARGATLRELLLDLDRRHPGLRFRVVDEQDRVRQHMNLFVGGRPTRDLGARIAPGETVPILQALSGG